MAPKFGTSGLRGLVTELTPDLVADHVQAFIAACPNGGAVHIGWDLRPSSPDIAAVVAGAVKAAGMTPIGAGLVPTPALALSSMSAGHAAVMVTGSHIPADRNGLKFYVPTGEIAKTDEAAILANLGKGAGQGTAFDPGSDAGVLATYARRYADAFGPEALKGLRIGVYEHSTVARDVMHQVLRALGADTVAIERSETFIPVDTEAVEPEVRAALPVWAKAHGLDAVVSTDGDADRPLVADAAGRVVPGDVLGPLTARYLGATRIVTPVSSNTLVDQMGFTVSRTKIGSPFVIAGMEAILAADPAAKVVGYEANGGFLLGFTAQLPAGPLAPLMTRDCLLPILAPLAAAKAAGKTLADLVATLPPRFTAADRVVGIPTEASAPFLKSLIADGAARADFFDDMGPETGIDLTDGLRVTFAGGDVLHLRPSGNAPEFRCYAEADTADRAEALLARYLGKLAKQLGA
ncbi:phosphomannomutase [Neotabrizicola shimadae]|uniref:Phosphomannomutase n=1 Tax=Neotabrizicola shimadae TaxID=2807096 RepID=A0A8G0ZSW2_9RHOB|nr:phosphomannomutase [Neotabrizicola shimadae]QYZ70816.1 phosphomannomutase [Neotabrizicola shimadae]